MLILKARPQPAAMLSYPSFYPSYPPSLSFILTPNKPVIPSLSLRQLAGKDRGKKSITNDKRHHNIQNMVGLNGILIYSSYRIPAFNHIPRGGGGGVEYVCRPTNAPYITAVSSSMSGHFFFWEVCKNGPIGFLTDFSEPQRIQVKGQHIYGAMEVREAQNCQVLFFQTAYL